MRTIGCVLAVMICTGIASADDKTPTDAAMKLVDGRWKITRLISLGSKHELTKPAPTTECMSLSAPYPSPEVGWPEGTNCTSESTTNGAAVTWSFSCTKDSTTTTGKGTLTYAGKKFSGTINIETVTSDDSGTAGRRGLLKISGAYVALCAPEETKK